MALKPHLQPIPYESSTNKWECWPDRATARRRGGGPVCLGRTPEEAYTRFIYEQSYRQRPYSARARELTGRDWAAEAIWASMCMFGHPDRLLTRFSGAPS